MFVLMLVVFLFVLGVVIGGVVVCCDFSLVSLAVFLASRVLILILISGPSCTVKKKKKPEKGIISSSFYDLFHQ